MFQKTIFTTIKLGLFVFPPMVSGQAANSSPTRSVWSNTTLISPLTQPATGLEREIQQSAWTQSADATLQPANPSAAAGVQASVAAPTVTLSASAASVPYGQSVTLAWKSANATACSGTGFSAS